MDRRLIQNEIFASDNITPHFWIYKCHRATKGRDPHEHALSRNRTADQGAARSHTPTPGRESTGQTNQRTMVIHFPAA